MALELIQPKRNEYQESSWRNKAQPAGKTDNITAIFEPIFLENAVASKSHNPAGAPRPVTEIALLLLLSCSSNLPLQHKYRLVRPLP
jgi:hypothetical protein